MGLAFRRDVFCRIVDGRAIILDLGCGHYFSPSARASRLLAELEAERSESFPDCEELRPLAARGWLVQRSEDAATNDFARWAVPEAMLEPGPGKAARAGEILLAVLEQAKAAWHLRRSSPGGLPNQLRTAAANSRRKPEPSAPDAILRAFSAADRILSPHDRCLPRSMALARTLAGAGHSASLVLGVRVNPFAAHAWVQMGDAVIGDDLDRVRAYRPILVL